MNRIAALMVVLALEELRDLPEDSPRALLAELPELPRGRFPLPPARGSLLDASEFM